MTRVLSLLAVVAALGTIGCAKNVPLEEIPNLKKISVVMWAQQTIAGPQLKKANKAAFIEQDWAAFADCGARIAATAQKIKDFAEKRPTGFATQAENLHRSAVALADAAKTKNVDAAKAALTEMKAACTTCHKEFR
jgi:cytochrome c556